MVRSSPERFCHCKLIIEIRFNFTSVFIFFPTIKLWQIMTPLGRGQFGPKGHGWQDL